MAWLRRLLTADPSPLAGSSTLSGPVGLLAVEEEERRGAPTAASKRDGQIVPRVPESRCAINYPEPAATAAPPVPVTGGLP